MRNSDVAFMLFTGRENLKLIFLIESSRVGGQIMMEWFHTIYVRSRNRTQLILNSQTQRRPHGYYNKMEYQNLFNKNEEKKNINETTLSNEIYHGSMRFCIIILYTSCKI